MVMRDAVRLPTHTRAYARISSAFPYVAIAGIVVIAIIWPLVIALLALLGQSLLCVLNLVAAKLGRGGAQNHRYRDSHSASETPSQTFRQSHRQTDHWAGGGSHRPVFSVHVPTHNEPPAVVIATLDALRVQRGAPCYEVPCYEVIVIDNNTAEPALWHPVAEWCQGVPGYRFMHCEGVEGAKAGALNIALAHCRGDASHIVVVDADYCVTADFLALVAQELAAAEVDYIQFPQAYVECGGAGRGIATELADYFERHAQAANRAGAMLLTGTLSVISRAALSAVGGWSARSSTEDAELGLRLGDAGFRGVYIDRIMGRGMLPLSLDALHRQRHRWASGNMRLLLHWVAERFRLGRAQARRRALASPSRELLIAVQLTAWNNFALPAVVALSVATIQSAIRPAAQAEAAAAVATLTLGLVVLSAVLPLCAMCRKSEGRGRHGKSALGVAICSRLSLLPTSALATAAGMLPGQQSFIVTPKCSRVGCSESEYCLLTAITAIWGLGLLFVAMLLSSRFILLGACLLLLPWLASGCASRALALYASALRRQEI